MDSKNTPNILKIDTVGPTGSHYGPPWARWVSTEVHWERTGCPLKPRWDPLGPTMVHHGPVGGPQGSHWVAPCRWGFTGVPLGPTMVHQGAAGSHHGPAGGH